MNIGFFEIENWERKLFRKAFPKDKLIFSTGLVKPNKNLEVISIFVNSKIDENLLSKMPKLKLITTRSTGFNHIDLEACKKRKITVCNVPVYGENTVAEHAFALILGLSRKLISCIGGERCFIRKNLRGIDLHGKTLGIMGCGNIGKNAARIGKGFGMKVLVFDLCRIPFLAKKIGFQYVNMGRLLKESDIVTIHVPYNKHTHHLINGKKLRLMKKTSFLINTSRGEVVDTLALAKALRSGKLSGAGLDVLEEEGIIFDIEKGIRRRLSGKASKKILAANKSLLQMENVLVTPHNAFNTQEALNRILQTTIKNIKGFKKKRRINVVKHV